MKKIVVCGSTGSIGRQTLDVCRWFPEELRPVALAGGGNIELLARQVREFRPEAVALADESRYQELKELLQGVKVEILPGKAGVLQAAAWPGADLQVAAISGLAGLEPTLKGLEAGLAIAFANKEVLVAAGELVMGRVKALGADFLPVDSEHSAIWQCLEGYVGHGAPAGLILTCSGGALREAGAEEIANADVERTLRHPTWKMGAKITVDSATLLNKGLEIIEAHWLFDMPYERISAVIHPESIVHSMVQYADGALLAQMSYPDMRLPIQYALSYPQRWPNSLKPLDFARLGSLSFGAVDEERFPCFRLAKEAGRAGGTLPAVLSGANEVLVGAFLKGKGPLGLIPRGLEAVLGAHNRGEQTELANIIEADRWAREYAGRWLIKQGF